MVWAQAVSVLEMNRSTGRPLESGKPRGHVLLAMDNSDGSNDEVSRRTQSPLINQQVWWAVSLI